jgi:hypothetical protein
MCMAMPGPVKVGLYAEATAPGTFKVVFDHFKLTRLPGNQSGRWAP